MSITKNTITATVVFEDSAGTATNPDAGTDITWTVYDSNRREIAGAGDSQAVADATATGTFEFTYTPTATGTYYVEAVATVGGVQQAARTEHEVTWV